MAATLDDLAADLDARSGAMLRAIVDADGEATTTEIREATNMTNEQVRHRREKLADAGLIDVADVADADADTPIPPKVHELTEDGERAVDAGLLDRLDAPAPDTFEEMAEQVQQLARAVNTLRGRVSDLENATDENRAHTNRRVRELKEDLRDRLDDVDERLEEFDDRLEGKKDKRW